MALEKHWLVSIIMIMNLLSGGFAEQMNQATISEGNPNNKDQILELGKSVDRESQGGEIHSYQFNLTERQYLHVIAEQKGIDVGLALFDPNGKQLVQVNSPDVQQGPETLWWVAEITGTYRLNVISVFERATKGRYEIKIEELRAANSEDKKRIAAQNCLMQGEQLFSEGKPDSLRKALGKYEEALRFWRDVGERGKEGITLTLIGRTYHLLGESKKAIDYTIQAISLLQSSGFPGAEAVSLSNIGLFYHSSGELQKALEYYNQALKLQRAAGDRSGEALSLNNIGGVYKQTGEVQKALEYYNQALPLRRSAGDRLGKAQTLNNIALAYDSIGEKQKALECHNQALPLRRAIGDHRGEAVTLNNLGLLYRDLRDFQKALDHFNQALPLRRTVGDRSGEANTLHSIGLIYLDLGEYQIALDHFNQALPLLRAISNRRGEAYTLRSIGSTYYELGENQKALDHFIQVLQLQKAMGDRLGEAFTLDGIGLVHDSLGEKQKALEYFNQALQLQKAIGHRSGEAYSLTNIGTIYYEFGEKQKALDYYNQALKLRIALSNPEGEATALFGIARVHRDLENFHKAAENMNRALAIIDSLRTKILIEELRISFFSTVQNYYEFYIDLLMQMHKREPSEGYDAVALHICERARARGFLDLLAEAHIDIRRGIDGKLLDRERKLQQLLNDKVEQLTRLLNGKYTEEKKSAAEKELEILKTELQQVQADIRKNSPSYSALTQPQPLTIKEIQQAVDKDTLLLEYALGDERSYLWAVTTDSIKSFELPKRSEIEVLSRNVIKIITARESLPAESDSQYKQRANDADKNYWPEAASLSRMILGPVADHLGEKRLLIVAEGILQYLPFAALPKPLRSDDENPASDFEPLIVRHEIVCLPSASTLSALRQEKAERTQTQNLIAILADPVFDENDLRVKQKQAASKTERNQNDLKDLPEPPLMRSAREIGVSFKRLLYSREEAMAISSIAADKKLVQVALDFDANCSIATSEELGKYRYVHFAAHGLLNSSRPELSGIVLSLVDKDGRPQNGFLQLYHFALKFTHNIKIG